MAKDDKKKFTIHVDGAVFHVETGSMTGSDLKQLAGKDPQFQVFLEGRGNEPDQQIGDATAVAIANGMHFYTVPPATFGR